MTPVAEVAVEILPKIFPELVDSPFFGYIVPDRYKSLEEVPYFKIESVGDTNGSHGSNKYHTRSYRIQVMAFIDLNKTDIEDITDRLDRGLETADFFQVYGEDRPHSENEKIQVLTRQYTTTRRK
ncbi:hypothetical protein BKP56_09285 [Marinilactibacillus sp. 15R]|uniref:hypothetical protein n=1 Tax=Marinilactibacillus sp. 15R TaxID=1911586 RepID=UPI00090AC990|nr:hypothetical protein [Marinilactibacillus sp. 15R]API89434.1 hypothetical protein BKP56_09285 [Marinilactibacillus sp. 15R]